MKIEKIIFYPDAECQRDGTNKISVIENVNVEFGNLFLARRYTEIALAEFKKDGVYPKARATMFIKDGE